MFAVIEVANGDYGPCASQLAIACESTNNNAEKQTGDSGDIESGKKTPTLEMQTLALASQPLLKNEPAMQEDPKDTYRVPSEWSKFCTLVGRCQVHYFRDWVRYGLYFIPHNILI